MRFFRSISFQIWLPFAVVFLLLAVVAAWYYPSRQENVLRDQKEKELLEMARAVKVSLELSIESGNFTAIQKAFKALTKNQREVSVVIYSYNDSNEPEFISFFPANIDPGKLLGDSKTNFIVREDFSTPNFKGQVAVILPNQVIESIVTNLNRPVFIALISAFLFTTLLFYFVARRVSRPIYELTGFSKSLIEDVDIYDAAIKEGANEISILRNSLNALKDSLEVQRSENKKILSGLELEVKQRTAELRSAVRNLVSAQTSAKLVNYVYRIETDRFEFSDLTWELLVHEKIENPSFDHFLALINPDAKTFLEHSFDMVKAGQLRLQIEFNLFDLSIWVAMTGELQQDDSGKLQITGTLQDITDRKIAEAEIQKLSLVAKLSTNGILFTDKNRRIIWANESTERLTGYTLAEMIGKSPRMFQYEGTDKEIIKFLGQRLHQQKEARVEIQNQAKDGRLYWLELHIQPYFDEFKNLEGFLAIEVDITERKRYEQELQESLRKEVELNKMKSEFITLTSHEFRTPLTTIQSNIELLSFHIGKKYSSTDENVFRYTTRVSREIDRLTSLMNDILILGRIESGKLNFKPTEIDLTRLLTDLLEQHQFVIGETRKIQFKCQGIQRTFRADGSLLVHVFRNLFSNALKYSKDKPEPICTLHFLEGQIRIDIQDFGIGIPEEEIQNLFQSFSRASNAQDIQGTGLGLQIAKQFLDLHDASITMNSKLGEGTTVSVVFKT